MKEILEKLIEQHTLSEAEAKELIGKIAGDQVDPFQLAGILTAYRMRGVSREELIGFREGLMELAVKVDLGGVDAMDLCGTGGDGKDTFNISTLSSFVVAGAGIPVAKHGNYGVSGICGSSNVLESLGVKFTVDQDILKRQLDESGICFLHAPLFHPALKNVAQVRKGLGIKTFFNMLGPLVNPASPRKQLTGVYDLELLRSYAYLFQQMNKQFLVLHSLDGYDEVSLTGEVKYISNTEDKIISPVDLGMEQVQPEAIHGGSTIAANAELFLQVIQGLEKGDKQNAVIANSGMAIHSYYPHLELTEAVDLARESLVSGKAYSVLKKFISLN